MVALKEKSKIIERHVFQIPAVALLSAMPLELGLNISTEQYIDYILSYKPDSLALAALVMIGLYALKSAVVFFPIIVLYVASGLIFPPAVAVAVNLAGLFLGSSISFFMGRVGGKSFLDRLMARYKKAQFLKGIYSHNQFFSAYLLRVVRVFPMDVVGIFLGSLGVRYRPYILGTLLGLLPRMLAATIMGSSIEDPTSPRFMISAGASFTITATSLLLYRRMIKKSRQISK